ESIHPAGGRQLSRHRDREGRIVDDYARQHPLVAACRLSTLIGLPPNRGHLAAGICGGHCDDGQPAVPSDGLGEPGRGASADGEEYAGCYIEGCFEGPRDCRDGHVLYHIWDPPTKIISELSANRCRGVGCMTTGNEDRKRTR